MAHSPITLGNISTLNIVSIFRYSSPPRNPVYTRRVRINKIGINKIGRGNVTLWIEELLQISQEYLTGQPYDLLGLEGNRSVLGVCLDVKNTILYALVRSLFVLSRHTGPPTVSCPTSVTDLVTEDVVYVHQP